MTDRHSEYMAKAIELALRGLTTTTPNPRVGCVIVSSQGEVVGQGYHQQAGQPHAEINALSDAKGKARGATAYVSLEPCAHQGRTGPCAQALIQAGVAQVVYAMQDPNPEVSGRGLAELEKANIQIIGPVLESRAREINRGFISRMERERPWLRCKMAMSLDGRTAMASGESQWITGELARQDVQRLRAMSCAIITGADSVLHDNPAMTVRAKEFGNTPRQPKRFVIDSKRRMSGQEKIFQAPGEAYVVRPFLSSDVSGTKSGKDSDNIVRILPVAEKNHRVDLTALLAELGQQQVNEVLLETGANLAGAFLSEDLIDEFIIYVAGKLLGSAARPLFDLPLKTMEQAYELDIVNIEPIGNDWKVTAYPVT